MRKEEFYYESKDSKTRIRALRYLPEVEVKAILQIAHGMAEFIDRYEGFAEYLCNLGYVVTGNDHLGHGASVTTKDNWGYFADEDGYNIVLEDMHTLTEITKSLYPDKPYFLLGHSMGSFFARYYLSKYGNELNAAIIMGTGEQAPITLAAGMQTCRAFARFKGWRYRSLTVNNMALGSYNKKWEPSKTHCDWLTKDKDIVEWYAKEPRCQFVFTLNGYLNLFSLMSEIIKKSNIEKIPKQLPILLVSGEDDPVGEFGKAPKLVYETYKKAGIQNVDLKLYPNDRHEILNETDKLDVYFDLYKWLEAKLTVR